MAKESWRAVRLIPTPDIGGADEQEGAVDVAPTAVGHAAFRKFGRSMEHRYPPIHDGNSHQGPFEVGARVCCALTNDCQRGGT